MISVVLFCEDHAHEKFVRCLIKRLDRECSKETMVINGEVNGGKGVVLSALKKYFKRVENGEISIPEKIVIVVDANCIGARKTTKAVLTCIPEKYRPNVIIAIPDPHIEKWLLEDSAAFKKVFGRGCNLPKKKCKRDVYKKHLIDQILQAKGIRPPLGGVEYTEEIVADYDIEAFKTKHDSLGGFLSEITCYFSSRHSV